MPWTAIAMAGANMVGAAAKGGMFSKTDPGKAGRTANQERVKAGKKQLDLLRKQAAYMEERAIEAQKILQKNNEKVLDRMDQMAAQEWWHSEQLRFDKFKGDIEAFNQSIEDYRTALNFNEISFNMAMEEEQNHMDDFYTNMRFEVADAKLTIAEQLSDSNLQRNQIRAQREGVRVAHQYEQAATSIQGLMEQGKLMASGAAGRSSRKAVQAVLAGVGNEQAARADALFNQNSQFRNQMQKSWNQQYYNKLGYRQSIKQINASIDSQNKAHEIRKAGIHAGRYADDLKAKSMVHPVPKLGRMTPLPWKQHRPEYQEIKEGTWKLFMPKQPQLSDENKIYGDSPRSGWSQALDIGLAGIQGYAQGGGFGGGGGGGTDPFADIGPPTTPPPIPNQSAAINAGWQGSRLY